MPHRLPVLAMVALLCSTLWFLTDAFFGGLSHPAYPQMQRAAQTMQAAIQIVRTEKRKRGLLQPPQVDPNQTGLIGSEYTDITTSLGVLEAKRTATNPDLAAAIVRTLANMNLQRGSPVVILMSGSLVGANIAAIAAVEALGLRPLLVSSLGASMFGATDPEFTWLDIESALHAHGLIESRTMLAVIGGGRATGDGLTEDGRDRIKASAVRHHVVLLESGSVTDIVSQIEHRIAQSTSRPWALLINVGGSVAALGTCSNGHLLAGGLLRRQFPCDDGTPGLVLNALDRNVPVLHLLNMRSLAAQWGLPYDPIPLPVPGNNRFVYGASSGSGPERIAGE